MWSCGKAVGGWLGLVVLMAVAQGCSGDSEEPSSPEAFDCGACTLEQVCWEAEDYDGTMKGGCMELPSACREDRTCDCIEASSENICKEAGGVNGFPLCRVSDEEPVVNCTITLG